MTWDDLEIPRSRVRSLNLNSELSLELLRITSESSKYDMTCNSLFGARDIFLPFNYAKE